MSAQPGITQDAPLILFYNQFWPSVPESLPDCPTACRLVFDPDHLALADAVVFHVPTLHWPIDVPKRPGQLWVAWSMESDVNYPLLRDPGARRVFDLTMTYSRESDVWCPYIGPGLAEALRQPPRPKTEPAPAVYFASNCSDRSGRGRYVAELMEHLPIDSYGRCLQNRRLDLDRGRETKLEVIARYRFTLAFENSISPDYVTEKFFDPLIAGSVPVYLGAPNIADFSPGPHSYIDIRAFAGPPELASYLLGLSQDEACYAAYPAWKREGLSASFQDLLRRRGGHPICQLCQKVQAAQSARLRATPPEAPAGLKTSILRTVRGLLRSRRSADSS